MKVFISYSTKDVKIAEQLYADVSAAGAEVFQFGETARFGESAWRQILEGITKSEFFIVLISENSLNSKPVQDEIDHAVYSCGKRGKPKTIVPAIVEAGATLPLLIENLSSVDLTTYATGLKRLLKQLGLATPKESGVKLPMPRLPNPSALLAAYQKTNPPPDPAKLWSRQAEKILTEYKISNPPTATPAAQSKKIDSLLANPLAFPLVPGSLPMRTWGLGKPLEAPIMTALGFMAGIIQWTSVLGALEYALEESSDNSFATSKEVYRGAATQYSPQVAFLQTRFYRVKAIGGYMRTDSQWSTPMQFLGMSVVRLSAPVLSLKLFTFTWTAVEGASTYNLQSSVNQKFEPAAKVYEGPDLSCPGFNMIMDATLKKLPPAYYRVRAEGNATKAPSNWSNVVSR